MGFGFSLGMIFIIFPTIVVLLILLAVTRKPIFGKAILAIVIGIFTLVIAASVVGFIFSKKKLDGSDFYGTYVIDRAFYPGKQADWQYNSFRFEIKKNDSVYFYHTDGNKILKVHKGIAEIRDYGYGSARIAIKMSRPTHHIVADYPTIYRRTWDLYMVLHSEKFNNVFFKKGDWEPITD
ncbi:hypothetical protein LRS05_14810 [Flavobacterium sp. J372]|uniref:hypothetical protein n=1 Tax=Flavobacterium sp. J372 TaxID=2898436 RepID=UPI002150DAE2|nr:hypothetical protein [Flavobacterium sp. J372]MCR5863314.1 hypothetical protein [Flavobacterium sp. J372]